VLELGKGTTVAERCVLIDAEKANYPFGWMCQILKVSESRFYEWRNRAVSATRLPRPELAGQVVDVFDEFRQTYDRPRTARELNGRGQVCRVGLG
jgi:hypothetical protein